MVSLRERLLLCLPHKTVKLEDCKFKFAVSIGIEHVKLEHAALYEDELVWGRSHDLTAGSSLHSAVFIFADQYVSNPAGQPR